VSGEAEPGAVICLDADVLIYAATPGHPIGVRIRALLDDPAGLRLCGSTMLLPELLIKPIIAEAQAESERLEDYLRRIELWPATEGVGRLAAYLGAEYRLDTMDAMHLATAVDGGADVFVTNNSKDFDAKRIAEIDVLYPDELPAPKRPRRGRAGR
jgi:predicted nucleic acid-binding protein